MKPLPHRYDVHLRGGPAGYAADIVLRPTLAVAAGTDHERVQRLLEKTEKACLVSASLSTPIRLEPIIQVNAAAVPLPGPDWR